MRVKRRSRFSDLDLLTRFLGFDFREGSKPDPVVDLLLLATKTGLSEARRVQKEIIKDTSALMEAAQSYGPKNTYHKLLALTKKTNAMRLKTEWMVAPGDQKIRVADFPEGGQSAVFKIFTSKNPFFRSPPAAPPHRILIIDGTKWIVYRSRDESTLRKWLYAVLMSTFENGEFSRLRRCRQCRRFFTVEDARREFCRTQCKDNFHNRRRIEEGYFTKNRRMRRKSKLATAHKLKEKGESLNSIMKKTGLPRRVLKRTDEAGA